MIASANELAKGNTHLHVIAAETATNAMGTMYLSLSAIPCNNPECEDETERDFLWLQDHHQFTRRLIDAAADNYEEGYEAGYEHALERHGIEEDD